MLGGIQLFTAFRYAHDHFPNIRSATGVPAFLRLMRRGRPRQKIDREGKLPSHAILLFVPSSQNDYVKASENLAIGLGVDRR